MSGKGAGTFVGAAMHAFFPAVAYTLACGVAYYVAGRVGLLLQIQPENIAVFWPASGIAAGALIAFGRAFWLPIGLGVFSGTVFANLFHGAELSISAIFAICNTLECLLLAALIRLRRGAAFQIDRLSNLVTFVSASLIATALAAVPAALALQYVMGVDKPFPALWIVWLASDLLGIVTVSPFVIALPSFLREVPPIRNLAEGLLALLLTAAVAIYLYNFDAPATPWLGAVPTALLLPLLLWLAARSHPIFPAAGSVVIALVIVWSTIRGVGWIGDVVHGAADRARAAQLAMTTLSVSALALTAILDHQRRISAALRANEQRLRIASTAAGLGVFEWHGQRDTSVWENDRMFEIFGRSREEGPVGLSEFRETLLHPDDRVAVDTEFEKAVKTGALHLDCRLRLPNGRIKEIEMHGIVERDIDGFHRKVTGVVADITQRKQASEALLNADRRKDEFLAVLGHELRNGLAPLRSSVDLLDMATSVPSNYALVRRLVAEQVCHLTRLVDDLLDASRITHGRFDLRTAPCDLREAIGSAIEMCRPDIDARRHRLRVDVSERPLPVVGDATRLAQAVANLLLNASKYTDNGGTIEVDARIRGNEAVVRVRDTGIGIAPDFLPRAFEPFEQSAEALKRADGGLGIGLMLVRQIVVMHGGRISAHSDGPGRGSEFTFSLPLDSEGGSVPVPLGTTVPSPNSMGRSTEVPAPQVRRILVVDDHSGVRDSLAELLRHAGHVVETAHDGRSTFEMVNSFSPDVVLLDLRLPHMGGEEVAARLRRDPGFSRTLIIGLTGEARVVDRSVAKPPGIDHILIKPASIGEIEEILRRHSVLAEA